jgi:REP-associated tyrosine transposase
MARPLRIEYPGAVYHVTSRGNEKKVIFKDDQDRRMILALLHRTNTRYHWICHAYCLMDNHYHLVIETPEGNLSLGMRQLNGVYTQWFNQRHDRVGHLFQGRYKAILIQKETHLLEVCRYVVLNPVRAHTIDGPEDWPWSSYRATAGQEHPHPCLTINWVLDQFSSKRDEAEQEYGRFVQQGINQKTIWSAVKGQALFGDDAFVGSVAQQLSKHKDTPDISKKQRYANRPNLEKIFTEHVLRNKPQRNRKIAEAVEQYGYTQRAIADHLQMHFTYISQIVKQQQQTQTL